MSAFFDQGSANMFPEDRPAVIAATRAYLPLVLGETIPEPRSGTRFERMSAHTNDTGAGSRIASVLARFPKEVDTAARPVHTA